MRRATTLTDGVAIAATLAIVVGAFGPWATAYPRSGDTGAALAVGGFGHGAWPALALAVVAFVAACVRSRVALAGAALVAAGWLALTAYALPGTLVDDWAYRADVAWGLGLALLGALAALATTLRARPRPVA